MHVDTDQSLDSRTLTAILYLNSDWTKADGGELRLYAFPFAPVDVEPQSGRLVLFSSAFMPHRYGEAGDVREGEFGR